MLPKFIYYHCIKCTSYILKLVLFNLINKFIEWYIYVIHCKWKQKLLIKYSLNIKKYIQKRLKTKDIILKFNPGDARGHPFMVISLPFGWLFFYYHHKGWYFIISSNIYLNIFNVMGYNQHAHTHFSEIIISEWFISSK